MATSSPQGHARMEPGMDEFEARVVIELNKGMLAWGMLATQVARDLAPVRTGRLAREIKWGEPYMVSPLAVGIQYGVSGLEYAMAQEFGSGLYAESGSRGKIPIIAGYWTGKSGKKALAFKWPGGDTSSSAYDPDSELFFFRRVMHPGVHPHPYLRPAKDRTLSEGRSLALLAVIAELAR